ncbi:MAG TPA: transketolase, partial [Candidatus Nanoarchaeia archaeon]|nr:transketolase [Candidatus Nanoarchaeia archaeon]
VKHILKAFDKARRSKKPCIILAKTIKGKGVSFLENMEGWHGKALNEDELKKALHELSLKKIKDAALHSNIKEKKYDYEFMDFETTQYNLSDMISTREAFGRALASLGKENKKVVVLDGDVKNSTMTEQFFKEYPERGLEFFIAEQNMAGAAIGFSALGYTPFVATFGAFLTRAHDFIRMAQYSNANIKFIGSHSGVSIGEDGPSQMGLEDLPMFLSMPESVVLYPCDAVSTEKLISEMAEHKGLTYLRTTREKTPVVYEHTEEFPIGKLKVLKSSKKDKVLVIAAGICVHEALKAYDLLGKKDINIRVIDLYSLKPVDEEDLQEHAEDCKGKVLVVEDHYFGGAGCVVSSILGEIKHLYIKEIPRSGKPEELRAKYKIDADAIVNEVLSMLKVKKKK